MHIPNAERAVITLEKLRNYLLDAEHPSGGSKAVLLIRMGYQQSEPQELEADLRAQHLTQDVEKLEIGEYGTRYQIRAPLTTPRGRVVVFRSIWQIDAGTEVPRLITLYPD